MIFFVKECKLEPLLNSRVKWIKTWGPGLWSQLCHSATVCLLIKHANTILWIFSTLKWSGFTETPGCFKLSSKIFFLCFLLGKCFFILFSGLNSFVSTCGKSSWNPHTPLKQTKRPLELFLLCIRSVLAITLYCFCDHVWPPHSPVLLWGLVFLSLVPGSYSSANVEWMLSVKFDQWEE